MSTYQAIVCKIHTRPHPNADRIQLGICLGNQVVVGLDTQDGELGVFFRTDGQLSEAFLEANDLIRRKDPVTGKPAGGFFEPNGRVRAQKFRGEISDGFWCPLSLFAFTRANTEMWQEGDAFDTLGDVGICRKYETPATRAQRKQRGVNHRRETSMFRMHVDTKQFRDLVDSIPLGSLVTFTEKIHGTSHRVGHVLDDAQYPPLVKFLRKILGLSETKQEWVYMSGTRRVILHNPNQSGYYGNEGFRQAAIAPLLGNLHPGEVVYLEIAGYTDTNAPIMSSQSIGKLQDKAEKKRLQRDYGDKMRYTYGCAERTCRIFVYRIVQVSPDGYQVELPWSCVKARCKELGVEYVPQLCYPRVLTHVRKNGFGCASYQVTREELKEDVDFHIMGPTMVGATHIREGVVIRVDTPDGYTFWLKQKSWLFGVLEGYLKEEDTYVDREEVA